MDISDVARRSGVPASTLRYYERQGLIRATRGHGGRRQFAADVLDQLALIALGQAGGLSLADIRSMFSADGSVQVDRARLAAQADALDHTILHLQRMRDGLRHAANCPAAVHTDCPTFQRLLRAAAAGKLPPQPSTLTRRAGTDDTPAQPAADRHTGQKM